MTDQSPSTHPFHALAVVMRDYLSYGESGMEDLKQEVHARRRKPVIAAFCRELQQVLGSEAPVPTDIVNREFQRRADEAAKDGEEPVEPMRYDDQQTYEALADLWEFLDLTSDGEPSGRAGSVRTAVRDKRSQLLWVDGDPVKALRAWMSWPALVLFLAGGIVSTVCWAGYHHVSIAFVRVILQVMTIAGFAAAAVGGGALWLRRVRYVNPDAFLPPAEKPKGTRR